MISAISVTRVVALPNRLGPILAVDMENALLVEAKSTSVISMPGRELVFYCRLLGNTLVPTLQLRAYLPLFSRTTLTPTSLIPFIIIIFRNSLF
ncbi:hypothetical protein RIF29_24499 [Crotalaria pallida]|uniref:Uncharacterized protein n=1 Tax=Crotalaria pallida TaxID=3830 RepID=A0AAN9I091_CROPI